MRYGLGTGADELAIEGFEIMSSLRVSFEIITGVIPVHAKGRIWYTSIWLVQKMSDYRHNA